MELITKQNTISSLEIAKLANKSHADLMKAIRKMEKAWINIGEGNFSLISYLDKSNRNKPMYNLTKSESLFVISKFNDTVRAKLILRWEELELQSQDIDFSNPDTIMKIVQNWSIDRKKRLAAENKVRLLQPKVDFLDKILDVDEKIDIGQAAKILELPFGRNTMFKKLREKGIFFKNKNEPKQQYIERKYFVMKEKYITRSNHEDFVVIKVLVTQKGLEFLSNLFNATDITKTMATIDFQTN